MYEEPCPIPNLLGFKDDPWVRIKRYLDFNSLLLNWGGGGGYNPPYVFSPLTL